jgi:hypothetical protein
MDSESTQRLGNEVARLLGSKVASNKRHVVNLSLNEPIFRLAIPLDAEEFKASFRVAVSNYSFEWQHRRGENALRNDAMFYVTFKSPDRMMFTIDYVPNVSSALGVPVYRQGFVDDETIAKCLLSDSVRTCLARIDYKPLIRLFLSPIQLEASSRIDGPGACASQVRVFMELMEALACARKPESTKKTKARKQ